MVIQFLKRLFGLSLPAPYIRDFLTSYSPEASPSGIFTSGETGKIAIEFLWHGREVSRGQLIVLCLEGLEDLQIDSPLLLAEIRRRLTPRPISPISRPLGHFAIADLTEGARFGSWGSRFADDRVRGIETFQLPPKTRFCFLLLRNTHLNAVEPHLLRDRFCFSFLRDRFVDVTREKHIFAFGNKGGLYNSPVFRIWGARGQAPPLDCAITLDLDWRRTLLGEELLHYVKAMPHLTCHAAIAAKTTEEIIKNSLGTGKIFREQTALSPEITNQSDLIPSIIAEDLKQLGIYDLIENEGTPTTRF
ncbi:MAG: hypothetical protein J7647_24235 [Cyanobacteria bacterium SBLK]|nr:hypothetical protein [Cyanobacteria bacterium SBLK]